MRAASLLSLLAGSVIAQKPQYPPAFPVTSTISSALNYAPSVLPTVKDPNAPIAQQKCPGYKANNVQKLASGITADLVLAGKGCSAYGNDIGHLQLEVEYQSQNRLNVRIYPKYLAVSNQSQYILSSQYTPVGVAESGASESNSDLVFEYSNSPTFQFKVSRASSNETIFSTYGTKIIFEDQYLELQTSMVDDYNIYGLADSIRSFRIPNEYVQTFWNAYNLTNDLPLDGNSHSTHPVYLETRYCKDGKKNSTSHGVYSRNAHGQDLVMKSNSLSLRTIGGSFDLYFFSGPTPKEVISQYLTGVVNTPQLPAYWHLGFGQVRWSYQNVSNLEAVLDAYDAANIQVETIYNDLDIYDLNRMFTNSPHYPLDQMQPFLERLHASGRYYMPILDPHIYVPNPQNSSDSYPPYDHGNEMEVYLRNTKGDWYTGVEWPGFVVWPDFTIPAAQDFWTQEIVNWHQNISFDGFWLDVSDACSFCTGSCGNDLIDLNPIHVPFPLPGDPNTSVAVSYIYPDGFAYSNASEAASASSALASQSKAYPAQLYTPTPTVYRHVPTPGVRNLTFPPYAINNVLVGHSLVKQSISPDATHNDGPYNSTEYELHNLYGHMSGNATYQALKQVFPGKRPFFLSRSTFAGSGAFSGHWGQDGFSLWGNMYFGISQALQFSIAGIPFFGVETCGFNDNADLELCTRWMQLSAWSPLYRNHNSRNTIAQEAYRWATTAESTRRIMDIRYSLLPYTYTLFYQANTYGETVLRALQWEFPNESGLKAVETQFMSGPSILVTPVLEPGVSTVKGVFPGIAQGQIWYDWYTHEKVDVEAGENKTLAAPILHQPVHIRGGRIIPMQKAGNTTKTSRLSDWSLIVALDKNGAAQGELYLDDGISLEPDSSRYILMHFANNTLTASGNGSYADNLALANITVVGIKSKPSSVTVSMGSNQSTSASEANLSFSNNTLSVTGLSGATSNVWSQDLQIQFS